jgi:anti-sigma factor RsiW
VDHVSDHVLDLLALAAAGALSPEEEARLAAHLGECAECAVRAGEWRALGEGLRDLAAPRPSPGLMARTREAVERRRAEREEQAWNRGAIGFLIVFGWTVSVVIWFVFELLLGGAAALLDRPLGPTALWFSLYLGAGWLAAAAATVLLGRHTRQEGRPV